MDQLNFEERAILSKARDLLLRVISIATVEEYTRSQPEQAVKYYEAHLTLHKADVNTALARAHNFGFHVSVITGDEELDGVRICAGSMDEAMRQLRDSMRPWAYCTCRHQDRQYLENVLLGLEMDLKLHGVAPIRKKIEAILLDERMANNGPRS